MVRPGGRCPMQTAYSAYRERRYCIYGIIYPNHPDSDDFTLSTSNMSEVAVHTKKCRYSKD